MASSIGGHDLDLANSTDITVLCVGNPTQKFVVHSSLLAQSSQWFQDQSADKDKSKGLGHNSQSSELANLQSRIIQIPAPHTVEAVDIFVKHLYRKDIAPHTKAFASHGIEAYLLSQLIKSADFTQYCEGEIKRALVANDLQPSLLQLQSVLRLSNASSLIQRQFLDNITNRFIDGTYTYHKDDESLVYGCTWKEVCTSIASKARQNNAFHKGMTQTPLQSGATVSGSRAGAQPPRGSLFGSPPTQTTVTPIPGHTPGEQNRSSPFGNKYPSLFGNNPKHNSNTGIFGSGLNTGPSSRPSGLFGAATTQNDTQGHSSGTTPRNNAPSPFGFDKPRVTPSPGADKDKTSNGQLGGFGSFGCGSSATTSKNSSPFGAFGAGIGSTPQPTNLHAPPQQVNAPHTFDQSKHPAQAIGATAGSQSLEELMTSLRDLKTQLARLQQDMNAMKIRHGNEQKRIPSEKATPSAGGSSVPTPSTILSPPDTANPPAANDEFEIVGPEVTNTDGNTSQPRS